MKEIRHFWYKAIFLAALFLGVSFLTYMKAIPPYFFYSLLGIFALFFILIRTVKKHRDIIYKMEFSIEEFIFAIFILLNIMDFFKFLPGEIDFAEKMLGMAAFGYLLYKVGLTRVFFGHENGKIDFLIIISSFILMFKNIIIFIKVVFEESHFLANTFAFVIENMYNLEFLSFYLGQLIFVALSVYIALKLDIKKPSLMATIHREGPATFNPLKAFGRLLTVFIILNAFFILVFNIMMEWLAVAIDTHILMLGILFYFVVIVKHKHRFNPDSILVKLGQFGELIYLRFVGLFHYKKTMLLGISGLLVLHPLTDTGVYMFSYLTGMFDPMYAGFGIYKMQLLNLMKNDILAAAPFLKLEAIYIYLLNIAAILFVLLLPALVWYKLFSHRELHLNRQILSFLSSALICFIFLPAFKIGQIKEAGIIGVNITPQSIFNPAIWINRLAGAYSLTLIFILSVIFGALVFFLSHKRKIRKDIFMGIALISFFYFFVYIFNYLASSSSYYINTIKFLLTTNQLFILFTILMYFPIIFLFYSISPLMFLYEIYLERKHAKWSDPIKSDLRHIYKKLHNWKR